MTPFELVERAREAGLILQAVGDRLCVWPKDRLTPELRSLLVAHKAEVVRALSQQNPAPLDRPVPTELARVLGLPLARLDHVIRIAVSWLDVPLYFVPETGDAEALVVAGWATRGTVWTRLDLLQVLTERLSKAAVRRVALARVLFDGELTEVALSACQTCRRRDWWRSTAGLMVCRPCHPPAAGAEAML